MDIEGCLVCQWSSEGQVHSVEGQGQVRPRRPLLSTDIYLRDIYIKFRFYRTTCVTHQYQFYNKQSDSLLEAVRAKFCKGSCRPAT